jgi:polyphenol oxidase
MVYIKAQIFSQFENITFGFSTKKGLNRTAPFYFNMSKSIGDNEETAEENRKFFFNSLGLDLKNVALQKQNHTDIITYVSEGGTIDQSDAMITDKPDIGLAISSADCTPVFLYDPQNKIIAGVHSGWRGTELQILDKTLKMLKKDFACKMQNIVAYIGPSISRQFYEVGAEFKEKFDSKYLIPQNGRFLLDVAEVNYDFLINNGLEKFNIQKSLLCSYQMENLLQSYRREGAISGRAFGVIAMKGINE